MSAKVLKRIFIVTTLVLLSHPASAQTEWESSAEQCKQLQGESALNACNEALSTIPKGLAPAEYSALYIGKGVSLGELGQNREALRAFKMAIKHDPDNAKAYYNMGVAEENLGHSKKALRAYQKASQLDKSSAATWGNLGILTFNLGRYEESVANFEKAKEVDSTYFSGRPEQKKTYTDALDIISGKLPPIEESNSILNPDRRECILRFTPGVGFISERGSGDPLLNQIGIKKELKPFDYILFNADIDVQIDHNWFVTGSFLYSHAFYKSPVSGGIDLFGIPLGFRYVLMESDYQAHGPEAMERLRYWIGANVGPYIKNESITVNIPSRSVRGSSTSTTVGAGAHIGVDYFFNEHIGLGIQAKFQYIFFDNGIMILSGGPSIIGRF